MYKRTVLDRLISACNRVRFALTEPALLKAARVRHEHEYADSGESPLVSITIPTWNRGQLLLDRTLPSIFSQTYKNLEVIVIGDCCPDNTPELMARVKDPRFRFINLPQRGNYPKDVTCRWFVAGTVPSNHGKKVARGKWIAYFDDDDVMTPDHIESLLRFAQKGNYEFAAGLYEEEREGKRAIRGQRESEALEIGGHSTWLYRSYLRFFRYNINSWRKSYNRPQDIDCQLRMHAAGVRIGLLEKVVSYILPRPGLDNIGLAAHLKEGV